MKEVSGYSISEQEFKKVSKWAEDVYNIAVIIDYFVGNQPEIEECYNLAPVIKNLRNNRSHGKTILEEWIYKNIMRRESKYKSKPNNITPVISLLAVALGQWLSCQPWSLIPH